MPTLDEIRTHQAKSAAKAHVGTIRSAVELAEMDLPEIDWLVPSLIAPGLTTIAGRSDAGKSWLLLQLGLAVSAGGRFLGNLRCQKADVLYLALEDNLRRIKLRLLKLGMNLTHGLRIDTANEVKPQNIEAILDEMPTVKMVMIDTLGRYLENEGIDWNKYAEVTPAAGALHSIAKEREIAVIACTHTKKGAKAEEGTEGVSGSNALVSVSDTVLMLSRKVEQSDGKLYVTGRDVEERTIDLEHTDDWLWYDINAPSETTITEFNQYNKTPEF